MVELAYDDVTVLVGDDERSFYIELEVDYEINNTGIGHYEYAGAKGYDAGTDYVENLIIEKITILDEYDEQKGEFCINRLNDADVVEAVKHHLLVDLFDTMIQDVEQKIFE